MPVQAQTHEGLLLDLDRSQASNRTVGLELAGREFGRAGHLREQQSLVRL